MMENLVVFANDWYNNNSRFQKLMRHLDASAMMVKIDTSHLDGVQHCDNSIDGKSNIITPKMPIFSFGANNIFNRWAFRRAILQTVKEKPMSNSLLITSSIAINFILQLLQTRRRVCFLDNTNYMERVKRNKIKLDCELSQFDIAVTFNPEYMDFLPAEKSHLILPGLDLAAYTKKYPRSIILPQQGLIAGCILDNFYEEFNAEYMVEVVKQLPDWNFSFIGDPAYIAMDLINLTNVKIVAKEQIKDLPTYCQHWDVSLYPFNFVKSTNLSILMLLWEYLAIGKPIIANYHPLLNKYSDVITFANTVESFTTGMLLARQHDDTYKNQCHQYLQNKTWEYRAAQFNKLLTGA